MCLSSSFFSARCGWPRSKRKKRPNLPKSATNVLRQWILSSDHFSNPYPTEEEKRELMSATGLGMKQLTNWFVNARKRIWQPMVAVAGTNLCRVGKRHCAQSGGEAYEGAPVSAKGVAHEAHPDDAIVDSEEMARASFSAAPSAATSYMSVDISTAQTAPQSVVVLPTSAQAFGQSPAGLRSSYA